LQINLGEGKEPAWSWGGDALSDAFFHFKRGGRSPLSRGEEKTTQCRKIDPAATSIKSRMGGASDTQSGAVERGGGKKQSLNIQEKKKSRRENIYLVLSRKKR